MVTEAQSAWSKKDSAVKCHPQMLFSVICSQTGFWFPWPWLRLRKKYGKVMEPHWGNPSTQKHQTNKICKLEGEYYGCTNQPTNRWFSSSPLVLSTLRPGWHMHSVPPKAHPMLCSDLLAMNLGTEESLRTEGPVPCPAG